MTRTREVLSVGIDVGTTTTQVVFSQLTVHDVARSGQVPRIQVDQKSVIHASHVHATPLTSTVDVDADALATLVSAEYQIAGLSVSDVGTGAVIITGEAARSRNADAILEALSRQAGDFVVTIAGPNVEAQIAGRGSGVARWSADRYEQVTTVDVGGGTSNAAIFHLGRHLCSSALAVGGRQLELDGAGRITHMPKPGRAIAQFAGLDLEEGGTASLDQLRRFCDVMASLVVDLVVGRRVDEPKALQLTEPLVDATASTSIFLTGGVAECYYAESPVDILADVARFGDVGPLLADSLRRDERFQRLKVQQPPETLHATVLGAAGQTVTLSGSTIWADEQLLPVRNLPVLRPTTAGRGGGQAFGAAVADAKSRWDLPERAAAAIVVELPEGLGFSALSAVAEDIVSYYDAVGGDSPLVLVMSQDYAKVLGQTIDAARPGIPLLVIDQVGLGEGDFIDIGEPMLDGRAVPLSIKTLVFYD